MILWIKRLLLDECESVNGGEAQRGGLVRVGDSVRGTEGSILVSIGVIWLRCATVALPRTRTCSSKVTLLLLLLLLLELTEDDGLL